MKIEYIFPDAPQGTYNFSDISLDEYDLLRRGLSLLWKESAYGPKRYTNHINNILDRLMDSFLCPEKQFLHPEGKK